ncbi:MAG: ATPase, T2SS/T4P/T4SS family, partial [Mariprofundaceae bacterium]|nr:ATPase, T2SS/T4P/T4SS family [Mariprofundaceae bacterium]
MQTAPQHSRKSDMGVQVHSNVRQITNAIIRRAMKENSSDIHIIPLEEHSTIRFRVNGELSEPIRIPISLHEQVISFFRDLAKEMNSEKSAEQLEQTMSRFEVRVGALSYDMEIEERPSSHGEYIVLHVCKNRAKKEANEEQLSLSGLHQSSRDQVTEILNAQSGVILLSGPFGSGKTTSMYSFLNYLHTQGKKAISFEKNIEMKIPNVSQISIGNDIHAFMAKDIFEYVEREKPNVIMIDHIGDQSTAAAAFALSAQGYLVISSIRAVDTSSVLSNLKAFGVANNTIADELKLSVSQRLIHRLCPECHKIRPADPATLVRFDLPSDTATFHPHGCKDCMGTGFSGRSPVHETCIISQEFGSLLRSNIPDYEFRQIVINAGMLTLFEDALVKALEGLVPLAEVLRNLPNPTQEHTVGSRLQRMSLLPNNKNLLVSTGDAEAMINQNNPNATQNEPSITQKIKAAEAFEESIQAPAPRHEDTLTLTEDDLPKKTTVETQSIAENVSPFTIKDEPVALGEEKDSSLLKTLSSQHELTDTVCLSNGINIESPSETIPAPRFQTPQPSFKQRTEPQNKPVQNPAAGFATAPPTPSAQTSDVPVNTTQENMLDVKRETTPTPRFQTPQPSFKQRTEPQNKPVGSPAVGFTTTPSAQSSGIPVNTTQENILAQEAMQTQTTSFHASSILMEKPAAKTVETTNPMLQQPAPATAESMRTQPQETMQTTEQHIEPAEILNQLQAEPSLETHQDFDVSSSHLPVSTPQQSNEAARPEQAGLAFDVSRQDFVEQGFNEQDFDMIQNKTMRFQTARTEPISSAADVLNQTVRFGGGSFDAQATQPSPQEPVHQQPTSPPFQAQRPDLPVVEQPQSFEPQSTTAYTSVPQQPRQRVNPQQQTQSIPAFQQPSPMQQTQPMQTFQQPAPMQPQQTQSFHAAPSAQPEPAANNYSQFETPNMQQPIQPAAAPEPQVRKKLLLVEDGHTIRDYISFILRSGGYDVVDVETAEEALSILFHDRPDALISDHILPGMNGTSLIATVRSHPRLCDIPTMLLTSEAKMEVEALRTGADSYLEKPVDPDL